MSITCIHEDDLYFMKEGKMKQIFSCALSDIRRQNLYNDLISENYAALITIINKYEYYTVLSLRNMHIIGLQKWKMEYVKMYYPDIISIFDKIRKTWKYNISNPEFKICKKRLMHEFEALKEV